MDLFYVDGWDGVRQETIFDQKKILKKLHELGQDFIQSKSRPETNCILTTDMDGVLIFDDNAKDLCGILAGKTGLDYFSQVSDSNIEAVKRGETTYCWNAPCVFVGSLLQGLPTEINRAVGRHMRLIPGTSEHIEHLLTLGYDVWNVTAGHQEGAEEVSKRVGISPEKTIATLFESNDGLYGKGIERFIGGAHKLLALQEILYDSESGLWKGSHVGDSYSDLDSMRVHPSSIAWNPTGALAVHSAVINVFGLDKRGLTPFYDTEGTLDKCLTFDMLPQQVVVHTGHPNIDYSDLGVRGKGRVNSRISDQQMTWGKECRLVYGEIIEREQSQEDMLKKIVGDIEKSTGLSVSDLQSRSVGRQHEIYVPVEAFQAKAEYLFGQLND